MGRKRDRSSAGGSSDVSFPGTSHHARCGLACCARRAGTWGDAAGTLWGSPHSRRPAAEWDSLREVMYSGALPGPRGRASS